MDFANRSDGRGPAIVTHTLVTIAQILRREYFDVPTKVHAYALQRQT
jgi:hypothetical protein